MKKLLAIAVLLAASVTVLAGDIPGIPGPPPCPPGQTCPQGGAPDWWFDILLELLIP